VKNNSIQKFHLVTIRGRYIYGYLCLLEVIEKESHVNIPEQLNEILTEFVSSDQLDLWHNRSGEALPSIILDEKIGPESYRYLSNETVELFRNYYLSSPEIVREVIESLMWLGISNLYSKFMSSLSLEYLGDIIEVLEHNKVELPNFSKVEHCLIKENDGWGAKGDLSTFL
jgi:hypothetical protein